MRPADTLSCRVGSLLQHSVSQRHLEAHQVAVGVLHEELANTRLLARTEAVPLHFRLHEQGPGRLTELPELHGNIGHGDLEVDPAPLGKVEGRRSPRPADVGLVEHEVSAAESAR